MRPSREPLSGDVEEGLVVVGCGEVVPWKLRGRAGGGQLGPVGGKPEMGEDFSVGARRWAQAEVGGLAVGPSPSVGTSWRWASVSGAGAVGFGRSG